MKNEILKTRYAVLESAERLDIEIAEDIKIAQSLMNKEELKLYVENRTSNLNAKIDMLEGLIELMCEEIRDIDMYPVLRVKDILRKNKNIRKCLMEYTEIN